MKRMFVVLLAVCATAAYAGSTTESPKQAKTEKKCAVKKAVVTGSKIPVKVDQNGRPVASTLKVTVVDEKNMTVWGFGSPGGSLSRLPMVYTRGRR